MSPAPDPSDSAPETDHPPRVSRLIGEAALVGGASLAAGCVSLQVWRADLRVPFTTAGDGAFYLMLTRGLERNGSYLSNPGLGFPSGQELQDLPHGADNLNLLLLRVAALVGDPGLALNLFFLATFALVGASMHVVLRRLGTRPAIAAGVSVLFALSPYHLLRSTGHVLLSAYYSVPIVVLLALLVLSDDPPLSRWRRWHPALARRDGWAIAACVLVASAGAYYAFFGLVLIAAGALAAAVARRTWRPLRAAALHAGIIVAVFVVNISPSIAYWLREGSNARVARRYPSETETFGLRISQLVVPRPDHRVPVLARAEARSRGGPIPGEFGQTLGLVAAVGFVLLLAIVVWRLVDRGATPRFWAAGRGRLLLDAGFLTLICLLTAAAGGFSYLLSTAGARDIRAWNRMSIVIAALAFLAVALLLSQLVDRLERRGRRRWGLAVVAVVVVVGLLDQTSPADGRRRAAAEQAWTTQEAFFEDVAGELPEGTPVYQLPVIEFPEEPGILGTGSYDHALAYVHAPNLRWSFGGMKGRVPPPPLMLDRRGGKELVAALQALGFRAIVVDRAGYTDGGLELEGRLSAAVGPAARVSSDGRYSLFVFD